MSTGAGHVVCVTGAFGYIASWLVKFLLQRGYTVKATVRDPSMCFFFLLWFLFSSVNICGNGDTLLLRTLRLDKMWCVDDPRKVDHLVNLEGAKERLHLVKANLLEEGSFDSAVQGCHAVFHTASPSVVDAKDTQVCFVWNSVFFSSVDYNILFLLYVFQAELLDPVVKGTLNVLKSCVKSPTLKRIVLTSSIAAIAFTDRPKNPNPVVEESWYSDLEFCKRRGYVSFPLINFHYKSIFDETSLENHTNSK